MKFDPTDFTKNNYKTPQKPTVDLLMGLGWTWFMASVVAQQYSYFEVEQAIKSAQVQSSKQGKNLVKCNYVMGILKNQNKPYNGNLTKTV